MAVFPDRIVLKNSTDSESLIKAAIASGGTDAIQQGELVIGRQSGAAKLYTLDSAGEVVAVGGSGGSVPLFVDGYLDANSTADTSHVLNVPTYKPGDLLIAILMWRGNGLPITEPAGWDLYGDYLTGTVSGTESQKLYIYTKTAVAGEPASYTWTGSASTRNCGSMVSVAYGGIDSVTEYLKSATGTAAINTSCDKRYLSIIAHTWTTSVSSSEVATMSGAGVKTLTPTSVTERRLLVGYTNESGTVSCSHASSDTANGAGAIVINVKLLTGSGGGPGQAYDVAMDGGDFDTGLTDDTTTIFDQFPISITAHSDVDTTTTAPTNGQTLVWDGTNWVPGTASTVAGLDDLTDVTITAAATGEVLRYNGSAWVDAQLAYSDLSGTPSLAAVATSGAYADLSGAPSLATVATSGSYDDLTNKPTIPAAIDDLSDVDTTTAAPTANQVLVWDGTNWVPGDQTGSGGGTPAGTIIRKTETQTASGGAATFAGIGASGLLVSFYSDIDAWVVLYPTAADRTADSGRAYGTDPTPGSGVLAEVFVAAGTTVLASPGTAYFNNDTTPSDMVYAAVRDQAGASADATVTIIAYAHQSFAGMGTNRVSDSGTASGGALNLTGLGQTGQLVTVTSSLDAWIVLYGSDADRTADAGRTFSTDPSPGSGVMAEFYVTAGSTILATPGTSYFNNDAEPTEAVYLAVRSQAGVAVDSLVAITAYAETSYTGISGGTFGSG